MSLFLDGIGAVLQKVTQWIPGKIEKLKNEKERLLNERERLLDSYANPNSVNRVIAIDKRLQQINAAINTKASD